MELHDPQGGYEELRKQCIDLRASLHKILDCCRSNAEWTGEWTIKHAIDEFSDIADWIECLLLSGEEREKAIEQWAQRVVMSGHQSGRQKVD